MICRIRATTTIALVALMVVIYPPPRISATQSSDEGKGWQGLVLCVLLGAMSRVCLASLQQDGIQGTIFPNVQRPFIHPGHLLDILSHTGIQKISDPTSADRHCRILNSNRAIFRFVNPPFRARYITDTYPYHCQQPVLQIRCSGHVNSDSGFENKLARLHIFGVRNCAGDNKRNGLALGTRRAAAARATIETIAAAKRSSRV
jgi:hypothetical protein